MMHQKPQQDEDPYEQFALDLLASWPWFCMLISRARAYEKQDVENLVSDWD
jgi:hypothetical protein